MGVHTSTEIEELSLRTPRLVAIYLCESEATATITPRRNQPHVMVISWTY
ncbi:hypothetical protein ACPCXA_22545 [Lysinibacillus agricola]